jgi:hypothetical protein
MRRRTIGALALTLLLALTADAWAEVPVVDCPGGGYPNAKVVHDGATYVRCGENWYEAARHAPPASEARILSIERVPAPAAPGLRALAIAIDVAVILFIALGVFVLFIRRDARPPRREPEAEPLGPPPPPAPDWWYLLMTGRSRAQYLADRDRRCPPDEPASSWRGLSAPFRAVCRRYYERRVAGEPPGAVPPTS